MKVYRIQHPSTDFGMWNTLSEEGRPLVEYTTNRAVAELPMPDSDAYRKDGRAWYSGTDSVDILHMWFPPDQMRELIDLGFEVFELEAGEVQHLPNEVIFTKESASNWMSITHRYTT